MNDLELARLISDDVGKQFALAKEVAEEYPGYCLVTLRGMCGRICQRIIEARKLAVQKSTELGTLIREISDRTLPDPISKDALHKLRVLGNKGAHPEEGRLADSQLIDLAGSALKHAVTALKFAYAQIYPDSSLAEPITIAPVDSGMKSLCYRAISLDETDAQYWVGKHFLNKATALEQSAISSDAGRTFVSPIDISEARRKADFWFELAAIKSHPAALYEHGRLLVERIRGDDYVAMGVNNIFRAAKAGNADANAFAGHICYEGLYEQPQDFVESRTHFELAAQEDHPSALTMLGVMYLRGEGGPANHQAAFDYTKKSAEAGYPAGQFNLYVHLWKGEIVEKDRTEALVWLNRSADQNLPEALGALAVLIEEGQVPDKSLANAEDLFSRCMSTTGADKSLRTKAGFHYARLLSYQSNRLQSLTTAADILQRCYEAEECRGELADACVQLSKSTIGQIRKLILNHHGTAEEITAAEMVSTYFFDSAGKPILKRSIGLDKLGQAMRDMSEAQKHLSPELYQRRLLEKIAPTLHAQIKREKALRLVSPSQSKIGRNDPCPCNSGKKFKHCCGNN
jgi:TPR repeat protein